MKKFSLIVLTLLFAIAPLASAYYTPDGVDVTPTGITYEGATKDAFKTSVVVIDPTANRTFTYPDADVTLGTPNATTVDTAQLVANAADATILQDVVVANSANVACNTTCGIAGCYVGFDGGTSFFVDCDNATADTCACDGATS